MYAMGLMGLLLAGLIALGAALGLFSGPEGASAARVTAEGYVVTRSASLDALRDAAVRSRISAASGADAQLKADELAPFAPPGWIAPTRVDGTPRWPVWLEGDVAYVYGPANAEEMAAIRKILRHPVGLAWCPPASADGASCAPPLSRPRDGTAEALPLPPEVRAPGEERFAVSVVELRP